MFNRSAIMKRAWAIHRRGEIARARLRADSVELPALSHRQLFANALRTAWTEAKHEVVAAHLAERAERPVSRHRQELHSLDMKDRWSRADHRRATELRDQIRRAA